MISRLRSHLSYANVGVTVALVLAASGFAVASIPSRGGVISACYSKRGGTLRVIDKSKHGFAGKCRRTEKALSWNQQGRPGSQGVQGLKGDPGDGGTPGAPGPPGPTFGATAMGGFATPTTPVASPDESSADATAAGRHFSFTLPTGGNAYIRFFSPYLGVTCNPSTSLARVGLYVDGTPVPLTSREIGPQANSTAVDLVVVRALSASAHAAEVRYDCPSTETPTGSNQNNTPTWTVLLLGS